MLMIAMFVVRSVVSPSPPTMMWSLYVFTVTVNSPFS